MQLFGWLRTGAAGRFGKELAEFMVKELPELRTLRGKDRRRADKVMEKAARRVEEFRAAHALGVLQKGKLANAFLWTLKDAGWPEEAASQMTDWLTMRL
jgi:hypothetical protein